MEVCCPLIFPWSGNEGGPWGELSRQHLLECGVLQRVILFSMLFNIYMNPVAQIVWRHRLDYHQYADDTQFYLLLDGQLNSGPDNLDRLLQAMAGWLK